MRYPAIASVLLVLGCDQEPTRPTPFDAEALIQAHSPSHYGVSANISLLSTPAYTAVDAASAAGTAGSLHLSIDAGGVIPRFPDQFIQSVAVFGYGWVDAQTGRGVVAVIHPLIGRDSHQNPDGWHTHPVTLAGGTASSNNSTACRRDSAIPGAPWHQNVANERSPRGAARPLRLRRSGQFCTPASNRLSS